MWAAAPSSACGAVPCKAMKTNTVARAPGDIATGRKALKGAPFTGPPRLSARCAGVCPNDWRISRGDRAGARPILYSAASPRDAVREAAGRAISIGSFNDAASGSHPNSFATGFPQPRHHVHADTGPPLRTTTSDPILSACNLLNFGTPHLLAEENPDPVHTYRGQTIGQAHHGGQRLAIGRRAGREIPVQGHRQLEGLSSENHGRGRPPQLGEFRFRRASLASRDRADEHESKSWSHEDTLCVSQVIVRGDSFGTDSRGSLAVTTTPRRQVRSPVRWRFAWGSSYRSSRMAARTFRSRSAGIGSILCTWRAWSRILPMTSASSLPRTFQSQSTPTSRHVYVLGIGASFGEKAVTASVVPREVGRPPHGARLSCGVLKKKKSFLNLRAPSASGACQAAPLPQHVTWTHMLHISNAGLAAKGRYSLGRQWRTEATQDVLVYVPGLEAIPGCETVDLGPRIDGVVKHDDVARGGWIWGPTQRSGVVTGWRQHEEWWEHPFVVVGGTRARHQDGGKRDRQISTDAEELHRDLQSRPSKSTPRHYRRLTPMDSERRKRSDIMLRSRRRRSEHSRWPSPRSASKPSNAQRLIPGCSRTISVLDACARSLICTIARSSPNTASGPAARTENTIVRSERLASPATSRSAAPPREPVRARQRDENGHRHRLAQVHPRREHHRRRDADSR
jgi:hypothetical protein